MNNDLLHKPPLTPGRVFRLSLVMALVLLLVGAASLLIGTAEVSFAQNHGPCIRIPRMQMTLPG